MTEKNNIIEFSNWQIKKNEEIKSFEGEFLPNYLNRRLTTNLHGTLAAIVMITKELEDFVKDKPFEKYVLGEFKKFDNWFVGNIKIEKAIENHDATNELIKGTFENFLQTVKDYLLQKYKFKENSL